MAFRTSTSKKRSPKRGKPQQTDFGGLDPKFMMSLVDKIPPNPATGRVDMAEIMKYMSENPSEMNALTSHMNDIGANEDDVDYENYDYASLAPKIVHESFWVIQLENMGMVDASGRPVDSDVAHSSTGLQPSFMIYCYDDHGAYRLTHDCIGLPGSNDVLKCIKKAIAQPLLPLKPCLPWHLLISSRLKQHESVIKTFLDSIPAPFHWRMETPEEAEGLAEGMHQQNQHGVRVGLEAAGKLKADGNVAFSRKDRAAAIKAYTVASEHLIEVLSQKPDINNEKTARRQLSICYSNRAAARLMPGDGMDAEEALRDGQAGEKMDPSYNKAYIRQATAHIALEQPNEAQDAVVRALRRPDLENDIGLVDRLIDLQTEGKGLSDDEGTFKNWMLDVMMNDKKSSERIKGLKGEWKRRCDAQFAKWRR